MTLFPISVVELRKAWVPVVYFGCVYVWEISFIEPGLCSSGGCVESEFYSVCIHPVPEWTELVSAHYMYVYEFSYVPCLQA